MKIKEWILCFLLCSSLLACRKKEEPVGASEAPVFSVTGTINQAPVLFQAGINTFYMFAGYRADSMNVFEFTGDLKQTCTNCQPQSVRIILRNYRQTTGTDYSIDSALAVKNYAFRDTGSFEGFMISFTSKSIGSGTPSHFWRFSDSSTSTLPNPVKTFPLNADGKVSYSCTFSNGCSSMLTYKLNLSPKAGARNAEFTLSVIDTNTRTFSFSPVDTAVAGCSWDFGDGNSASGTTVVHSYSASGIYTVCLRETGSFDSVTTCHNIAISSFQCLADFSESSAYIKDGRHLAAVTVEYTSNGITYSSDRIIQDPGKAYFQILSSSPYLVNEKGLQTRKLGIRFNCTVSDGVHQLEMKNMSGIIAVAHP